MPETGLVDVQDSLAGHHQSNQLEGELLPLVEAAYRVGSDGQRLRPLELQAKLIGHDLPCAPDRQTIGALDFSLPENMANTANAAILPEKMANGIPDFSDEQGCSPSFGLAFLNEFSALFPGNSRDQSNGDLELFGNVPEEAPLDIGGVGDTGQLIGSQVTVSATTILVT